jgi:WD40 repeat protein
VIAYVDAARRVVVADADSARRLWRWRSSEGGSPAQLAWSPPGGRLLVVHRRSARLFDPRGTLLKTYRPPPGRELVRGAFSPDGRRVALVVVSPTARRGQVALLSARGPSWHAVRLFAWSARLRDLAWSPNGRWLLLTWPDADQWLFVRATAAPKLVAVSNISREFDPDRAGPPTFPRLVQWCCG